MLLQERYNRCYVLPIEKRLRGSLLTYSRLYAYPTIPEPAPETGFVILDSGAFGLSMRGQYITEDYMGLLNQHYETYRTENVFCACPDEFLNPQATVRNWEKWYSKGYVDVFPIIQFETKGTIRTTMLEYQLDAFADIISPANQFIAISNPSIRGNIAHIEGFAKIISKVKDRGYGWVHCLGAGWSTQDIADWANFQALDSFDSIAYYTSVQQKDYWTQDRLTFKNQSIKHAEIANKIVRQATF